MPVSAGGDDLPCKDGIGTIRQIIYRYVDLITTVPLQMSEFNLTLESRKPDTGGMFWRCWVAPSSCFASVSLVKTCGFNA